MDTVIDKVYLMQKYRFFRDGYVRPEITQGLDRDMASPVLQNFLGNAYFIEHGRGGTGNSLDCSLVLFCGQFALVFCGVLPIKAGNQFY